MEGKSVCETNKTTHLQNKIITTTTSLVCKNTYWTFKIQHPLHDLVRAKLEVIGSQQGSKICQEPLGQVEAVAHFVNRGGNTSCMSTWSCSRSRICSTTRMSGRTTWNGSTKRLRPWRPAVPSPAGSQIWCRGLFWLTFGYAIVNEKVVENNQKQSLSWREW